MYAPGALFECTLLQGACLLYAPGAVRISNWSGSIFDWKYSTQIINDSEPYYGPGAYGPGGWLTIHLCYHMQGKLIFNWRLMHPLTYM